MVASYLSLDAHNDGRAGASLRFAPWKNSLSGAGLTIAAARVICTLVNNRVDDEPVRRRRSVRLRGVLPLSL